ncbi:F0F1 ATP synthase subunit delta [Salinarimonas ramus]|uniref:F0F1 ATP synthase subunit delta n=1 Tax=Salinarimonas ramus TaxID=690164 RepID=UPI001FCE3B64|nr:F0F1 ATP synthase subunit delta [Salinarimonas ramus]
MAERNQEGESRTGGSIVSGVAGRYASALFELAQDQGVVDAVESELVRIEALAAESEDLRRLLKSPVYTADEQKAAMGAVLDRVGIGGLTGNFVRLVASKRRLFLLMTMIRDFKALNAQAKGIVPAEVRVAEAPSEALLAEIRTTVRDLAQSEVSLDVKVDPALIGGLVVKVGSRMIDASLRTKLNAIRLSLKEAR